jgi:hypothetical protein
MEIEQSNEQKLEQKRGPGTPLFAKGVSGNPVGYRGHKDRIAAAAADFVVDFRAVHGREPTRSERSRIETAADLRVNSRRRRITLEDKAKLSNAAERILRKLGIDRPAPAPSIAPQRPSPLEVLDRSAGK